MKGKKPHVYITMGDINGIGPEVCLKALSHLLPREKAVFTIVGSPNILNFYLNLLKLDLPISETSSEDPTKISFIPVSVSNDEMNDVGAVSLAAGEGSAKFIKMAVTQITKNKLGAIVTAPISKESLWMAGYLFPGQTEFLADLFGVKQVVMTLVSGSFRVGFITTHFALREVPDLLNQKIIEEKCVVIRSALRRYFRISKPKIAIAALNPHGGENGKLGKEEKEIIIPAVKQMQQRGLLIEGPFPSDTLFTPKKVKMYDAFIALYHDQGMIPIKMNSFGKSVNFTAGLPYVRTSPDHGTAFDIAGKGVADESSMVEAIKLAIELVQKRS